MKTVITGHQRLSRPTVWGKDGGFSDDALDRCVTATLAGFLDA